MKTWTENGINYVSYVWYHMEKSLLDEKVRKITGDSYGIYIYDMSNGINEPVQMGVNWPACGTVSADEAVNFANNLQKIAYLASSFRYNGYEVSYGDGCSWKELSSKEQMELMEYASANMA